MANHLVGHGCLPSANQARIVIEASSKRHLLETRPRTKSPPLTSSVRAHVEPTPCGGGGAAGFRDGQGRPASHPRGLGNSSRLDPSRGRRGAENRRSGRDARRRPSPSRFRRGRASQLRLQVLGSAPRLIRRAAAHIHPARLWSLTRSGNLASQGDPPRRCDRLTRPSGKKLKLTDLPAIGFHAGANAPISLWSLASESVPPAGRRQC